MTETTTRRKTEQALKIMASWTPSAVSAAKMGATAFGKNSPLSIRGGRLTINAAVAFDATDKAKAALVFDRIAELRDELVSTGTLHSFSTQAGSVPAGTAERLPDPEPADEAETQAAAE